MGEGGGDGDKVAVGLGVRDGVGDGVGDAVGTAVGTVLGWSVGSKAVGDEVTVGGGWLFGSLAAESGNKVALGRMGNSVATGPILETMVCSCAARNPVVSSMNTTRLAATSPIRIGLAFSKRRVGPVGCFVPSCHRELMLPRDDAH